MKIRLDNVRIAFPQLFEAKQINGQGDPKFGASFLFPAGTKAKFMKSTPVYNEDGSVKTPAVWESKLLDDIINDVAVEKWKDKAKTELAVMKAKDTICVHNGDLKPNYDGYPGNFYLSASSVVQPTVLNSDKTKITSAAVGKPYSGCYVNASVDIYAQDNKFGKRINAVLTGVQFAKDGESFSGSRPASEDEFDSVDYEEEALV